MLEDGQLYGLVIKGVLSPSPVPWSEVDLPADGAPVVALNNNRMVLTLPSGDIVVYPPPPANPYYVITGMGSIVVTTVAEIMQWYDRGGQQVCMGSIGNYLSDVNYRCLEVPPKCRGALKVRWYSTQNKYVCVTGDGDTEVLIL
jgi:hypothetical protein